MTPSSDLAPDSSSSPLIGELLDRVIADHPELVEKVSEARRQLVQHEQQKAHLAALNEAGRDLTRVRDIKHTLQAVVDRAHQLLGTDVAYLSARTSDGNHFEVREWAGQLSPAIRGIAVSVGSGVGGQVASSRRPFQVEDYQRSELFNHTRHLDTQMAAEGLVALLGVPLEVDGNLLGILFAGHRRPMVFTPVQVELMVSLATHAAVALDNALLFQSQRSAMADLEESAALLRAHTSAVEHAADAQAQMNAVLLRGDGIAAILDVVVELLGGSAAMIGENEEVLAQCGPDAPQPPFSREVPQAVAASLESGRSQVLHRPDGKLMYLAAASAGSHRLGGLLFVADSELAEVELLILERATQSIAISMLADVAAIEADLRAEGDALRRILDDRQADGDDVRHLARRHRVAVGGLSLLITETHPQRLTRQLSAARALCDDIGGVCSVHNDQLVAILPVPVEAALQRFGDEMDAAARGTVTIAAAWSVGGHGHLTGVYEEVRQCLSLLEQLGRVGERATTDELGFYSLLLPRGSATALNRLLDRTIGPLLDHDRRHSTSLAESALSFLDTGSNLRTAESLGLHVNTVAQRLSRIDRILGSTWRKPPRRLEIHHALRLTLVHMGRSHRDSSSADRETSS